MKTLDLNDLIPLARLANAFNGSDSDSVPQSTATDHGLSLIVADRGHVWVGHARDEGDYTLVTHARIVRVWGTEHGLNQIAVGGPTSKTKLDAAAPLIKVARRAVIAIIPCEVTPWAGK